MKLNRTVYIAGPYSSDPERNVRRALLLAERLIKLGFTPYVPHLSHWWHKIHPHSYDFWMDYDREWLDRCDYLVRFSGESPGADNEVAHARAVGIPIFSEHELIGLTKDVIDGRRTRR